MKMKILFILAGMMFLFGGCGNTLKYRYAEGQIYGTFYHISYASSTDLDDGAVERMESVNASLSMFNPKSVISAINDGITDQTDSLFRKMFRTAVAVNRVTAGAFDISVAPLVNAWGFGYEKHEFPDSAEIDSLLCFVGMDKVRLEQNRLIKKYPGIQLDASSIAKGLGVDLVADYLEEQGVENYMVEIGGELRVKGESEKKRPWRIGVDRPEELSAGPRQLQMIVGLTSGAVATSGNYRNFYVHEGRKIAHTINPKTGFPVQTEVLSASVYAPSCMVADAYATAFMVSGLEEAKRIISGNQDLEGCLIYTEDGMIKTWISQGLEGMLISEGGGN